MWRIQEEDIVIVGAGISGLATSLALHRKGIRSVVVERADSLRTTGANINIYSNGWRVLEQLGVASQLRSMAIRINLRRDISLDDHTETIVPYWKEELRCLRRKDLVETLAKALPPKTIRFGYHIVGISSDPNTCYPTLELHDGRIIKPKIVIGCDGVNSVVSKYLGLKPPIFEHMGSLRGFTSYANGHGLGSEFIQMRKGNDVQVGRSPVDEKLVCWYISIHWRSEHGDISKDPSLIHRLALQKVRDYPSEIIEMVRQCDIDSLSLRRFQHRQLRELVVKSFSKGNMVVVGDAMHVMAPYFGQGGCSALEDAVVLARSMVREMCIVGLEGDNAGQLLLEWGRAGIVFEKYVKERRSRLLSLALKARLIGRVVEPSTPFLVRFICIVLMILFFQDDHRPTRYDCGNL